MCAQAAAQAPLALVALWDTGPIPRWCAIPSMVYGELQHPAMSTIATRTKPQSSATLTAWDTTVLTAAIPTAARTPHVAVNRQVISSTRAAARQTLLSGTAAARPAT
jgi:hypothetical protein